MSATAYLLFFFSSLGVFNGFILASWILTRANKQPGDNWLAVLLLLISIRIGKSVAFYFTPDLSKNILQLGLTACVLIGPCLVTYLVYKEKIRSLEHTAKWFLIGLTVAIVILGIVFPYNTYLDLWQNWVFRGSSLLWLLCLFTGCYLYRERIQSLSGQWHKLLTDKAFITIIGSSLIWLAYFTASYTSYIMGALSFTLILYLSVLILLKPLSKHQVEPLAAPRVEADKYANNKLTDSQTEQYSATLNQLMANEQLFIDPQLSLPRLAKRLGMSHTTLSQLLNDHYQMNFKQYINSQRVLLAQKLLVEQPNASIDHIAEQSGFSASSTFYSAFKQQTGVTPNRFRTAKL